MVKKSGKQFFLFCLVSLLAFSLVGCSSSGSNDKGNSSKKSGAGDFPKKPVTLIVPTAAGGGSDTVARSLASATEKYLGESIGVVNKPGGSGSVGMTEGSKAKPDGYTVTMVFVELTTLPHLGLMPITYKDFKPIGLINLDPAAVTVPADAPYDTLKEFIQYAKKHPGKVEVGNSGSGSIWDLATSTIEKQTGVKFTHVPFDGAAPAVTSLVGGHIDAVTVSPAEVLSQVKGGKLKTLGVMSDKRSKVLPDVPTFKEAGFDVNPIATWRGLVVPKETPDAIADKLNKAFMKGANTEKFKSIMEKNGLGIELKDPKEFSKLMADDNKFYGKLQKDLGLTK